MIFVSYSNKDVKYKKRFETVCKPALEKYGNSFWSDAQIGAGEWEAQIDAAMNAAEAAVFLVSTELLVSKVVREKELPFFLKAFKERKIPVIWVLIETCMFEYTPIAKFQCAKVEPELRALSEMSKDDQTKTWCRAGVMLSDALDKSFQPALYAKLDNSLVNLREKGMVVLDRPCGRQVEMLVMPKDGVWYRQGPVERGTLTADMQFGSPSQDNTGESFKVIGVTLDVPLYDEWFGRSLPPHRMKSEVVTVVRK